MTREDKELLFKDLCARLPYGVMFSVFGKDEELKELSRVIAFVNGGTLNDKYALQNCKPYLYPMSSMTEEEVKDLLFVRLASKYGESCVYIKNFIKLNEISFRKEYPYRGTIDVWFSFENKIHDTPQIIEYSKCEHLGRINDITLAEIDWLNAHHFDYRGLIPKGLAIAITEKNNPYNK